MTQNIIFPHYMEDTDLELVRLKLAFPSELSPAKLAAPTPLLPPPPSSSSSSSSFLLQQFFLPTSLPLVPPPPLHHSSSHPSTANSSPTRRKGAGPTRPSRSRKLPMNILRQGKSPTVPAPYPWATTERAKVRSLKDLLSGGIDKIKGDVQCKRCDREYQIEYDLQEKFHEVDAFFTENMDNFHDRAPPSWMNPKLPNCRICGQNNCVKPVLDKKRSINWLFLFLGQMLGCCKLAQLKYFCKHTKHHRTGAKDRVLFLTYVGLRKQLES